MKAPETFGTHPDTGGWSFSARRLLQRLRQPAALESDRDGIALRDALGAATVFDAVRMSVERALAHGDPRLASIVERCDFRGDTVKVVAMEMHLSLRHVFRFRALAFDALGAELERVVETRIAVPRDPRRAEAVRLLARAQFTLSRRAHGDDFRAIALAEQALAADPSLAEAWCVIAIANMSLTLRCNGDGELTHRRSEAAIARAEELRCKAGIVLGIRALAAHLWLHDARLARSLAEEAVATAEGAGIGHHALVYLALDERAFDAAEWHAAAACRAEPGRWLRHQLSAAVVHLRGDFARCVERCAELRAVVPEDSFLLGYQAEALNALGRYAETIAVVEAAPAEAVDFSVATALARAHALAGDNAGARDIARRMRAPSVSRAAIALTLGDEDEAWAALELARHEYNGMLTLTKFDPVFEPFRDEPRYREMVR